VSQLNRRKREVERDKNSAGQGLTQMNADEKRCLAQSRKGAEKEKISIDYPSTISRSYGADAN